VQCIEGTPAATYYFDSCGVQGEKIEDCPLGCSVDLLGCGLDNAQLYSKNVPAGAVYSPDEVFTMTWSMKNSGTTTWREGGGYLFKRVEDTTYCPNAVIMSTTAEVAFSGDEILPEGTKSWSISMKAPGDDGTGYRECWQMFHGDTPFGEVVWVDIDVSSECKQGLEYCEEDEDCCSGTCCECSGGCGKLCKSTTCEKDCMMC
jgi:hypothetical protein